MAEFAAFGASYAAAVLVAIVYWLLTAISTYNYIRSRVYLYLLGGFLAGSFRGIAFTIRAVTLHAGYATTAQAVTYTFFLGAGYGLALAVHIYLIGGWLLNTAEQYKPKFWSKLRMFIMGVYPSTLILGPGLGMAAAILTYVGVTSERLELAFKFRQSSTTGLFIVACISVFTTFIITTYTVRKTGLWTFSINQYPHYMFMYVIPSSLLLFWSSCFRRAGVWEHPTITADEHLFYPLQVLPEMLQLAMWCIPTLFGRAWLSSNFKSWWIETHGADGFQPLFGFASEMEKQETQFSVSSESDVEDASEDLKISIDKGTTKQEETNVDSSRSDTSGSLSTVMIVTE